MHALVDPFNDAAMGAQVPDEYPFPTATYHLHNTVSINITAPGSVFSGLILPTPTLTYVDNSGAAATNGFFAGAPVNMGTGGCVGLSAMTSDTLMNSLGTASRVVGFGIRVKNNLNFSTVQGRVIVAPIIVPNGATTGLDQTNINNSLGNSLLTGNALIASLMQRLSGNAAVTSSIQNLPGSFEFALDELIDKEFMFTTRPIAPHGKDFRMLTTRVLGLGSGVANLNAFEPTNIVNSSTGTVTTDFAPTQAADCGGLLGFAIYVEGVPTGTVPILIETICHLEFEPRVNAAVPTPSNNHKLSPMSYMETLQAVAQSPLGRLVLPAAFAQARSMLSGMARMSA